MMLNWDTESLEFKQDKGLIRPSDIYFQQSIINLHLMALQSNMQKDLLYRHKDSSKTETSQ